jgi:imidazolonepropionase-like amidohydrolase
MGAFVAMPFPRSSRAQGASTPPIMFANFRLFDGKSDALREGLSLIVEGKRIKAVATGNPAGPEGSRTIGCGGRSVMRGLIDAHWHCIFAALPVSTLFASEVGYIFLAASAEAERALLRGFTTVRDLGGPSFALKRRSPKGSRPDRQSTHAAR